MDFSWVLQIIALGDSWATSVSSALEPSFGTVNTTHVEPSRPVSFRCFQESAWYDFSFYQWLLLEGSIFSAEMFGRALVSVFEIVGLVRCWQYWFNFCLYMVVGAPSKNYLLDYGWMITVWNSGRSALTRRVDEWWRLSFGIEAAPWDDSYPAHDQCCWKKKKESRWLMWISPWKASYFLELVMNMKTTDYKKLVHK